MTDKERNNDQKGETSMDAKDSSNERLQFDKITPPEDVSSNEACQRIPSIDGDLSESDRRSQKRGGERQPKRVLHFCDGVIEEYSTDEETEEDSPPAPEHPVADPRTLTWLPWLYWRTWTAGGSMLSVLDSVGEKFAWWMGITSPKYYYEIQEALRMKEEEQKRKAEEDAELAGWRDSARPTGSVSGATRTSQPSYNTNMATVLQETEH